MEKKDKLKCILIDFEQGEITLSEASNTILRLFSVSGCKRCKELEFMIENGLGFEDMKNDITYPRT